MYNPYFYNPAYAGMDSLANLYISHKEQWKGMTYSPKTSTITVDGPLFKKRVGLGLIAFTDQTHVIKRIGVGMTYAYHLKLSEAYEHRLSAGLTLGFLNQRIDLDLGNILDQNDQMLTGNELNATAFDLAMGINYRYKGLSIGGGIPQMTNSSLRYLDDPSGVQTTGSYFRLIRHYYARASWRIKLGRGREKDYELEPGVMYRGIQNLPAQFDVNAILRWKGMVWGGVGFRTGNDQYYNAGLNFSAGVFAFKLISLTYTYETVLDRTRRQDLGPTHEFLLGIQFGGAKQRIAELERMLLQLDTRMKIEVDSIVDVRTRKEASELNVVKEALNDLREQREADEKRRQDEKNTNGADERIKTDAKPDLNEANSSNKSDNKSDKPARVDETLPPDKDIKTNPSSSKPTTPKDNTTPPPTNDPGKTDNKDKNIAEKLDSKGVPLVLDSKGRVSNIPASMQVEPRFKHIDTLESIYFGQSSSILTEYSKAKLTRASQYIFAELDPTTIQIVIYGNASEEGNKEDNMVLSLRRARAVKDYLMSIGITSEFVITVPNGSDRPVTAHQMTEAERMQNRRVDLVILSE
jgi:type IX secretion system PorP/SprF family membrane protein